MFLSFHYAASVRRRLEVEAGMVLPEGLHLIEAWSQFWYAWVSATFLSSYLETAEQGTFLPKSNTELQVLLDAFVFEKAIRALGGELNNRPDWVDIPLQLILQRL
jgi:maltose alpha-D-glucosyltransferase/alpha-amylase